MLTSADPRSHARSSCATIATKRGKGGQTIQQSETGTVQGERAKKRRFTKKHLLSLALALLLIGVLVLAGILLTPRPTTKWSFQPQGAVDSVSSPLESSGLLYILLRKGDVDHNTVYALEARSGQVKWSTSIEGFIGDAPQVANGLLFVLASDPLNTQSTLHALDAASGREQWSYQHTSLSAPIISNGIVYTHSSDGNLFAFEARSGHQLWSASVGDGLFTLPVVVNHTVYIAAAQQVRTASKVFALDAASGSQKWSVVETTAVGQLAVANGLVYLTAVGAAAQVSALDTLSGRTLWSVQLTHPSVDPTFLFTASSFQVINGMAYVTYQGIAPNDPSVGSMTLHALDARTGQQVWKAPTISGEPTIANGTVYHYSSNGTLSALDARSGRHQWSHQAVTFSFSVQPEPAVTSDTVYLWTTQGARDTLYALNAASGNEQWSYQSEGSFSGQPTLAQGLIYVLRDEKGTETVEAIQPPGGASGFSWKLRDAFVYRHARWGLHLST